MIVLNWVLSARVVDWLVQDMVKAVMPLSCASLGNRVAYASSMIDCKSVTEAAPHSAAATEIRLLVGEVLRRAA